MGSIFSKIIAGDLPCHKIAETEDFLAFLDIMPLAKGHVLVIPKKETDYIFDIEESLYKDLWAFAQTVSRAVKKAIPCKRVGVAVIGLEVPHAHIHLVPINEVGDINFSKEKMKLPAEELEIIAKKIKAAL